MENPADNSQPQPPVVNEITPDTNTPAAPKPPKPKKYLKIAGVVVGVLVLIGVGVFIGLKLNKKTPVPVVNDSSTHPIKKIAASGGNITAADGSQFYTEPKALSNLDFFKDPTYFLPDETAGEIDYAQIGVTGSNQPIIAAYDYSQGGEDNNSMLAVETSAGNYSILTQFINPPGSTAAEIQQSNSSLQAALNPNVTIDTTDTYGIAFPKSAKVDGEQLGLPYSGDTGDFIDGLSGILGPYLNTPVSASDLTKLGQQGVVTYYEVTVESKSDYQVKEIYGVIGGVFATVYAPTDPMNATTTPNISWTTGSTSNPAPYTSAGGGCGSPYGYVITAGLDSNQLIPVGSGPDGTLYELPESSALFSDYYSTEYAGGSYLEDTSLENLTADQFQNDHMVVVAKNSLGEYVVYERTDVAPAGGCGKPVIYLYPQKATDVSVKVGADINKSNPTYGVDGWQNVLAQPDGQLTYKGQSYPYLFWEGNGNGIYPSTDTGFIVSKDELVSTIRTQLSEQGLNQKEVNDFMAYWQPKLPSTPYTRLTWFSTAQMDKLAPLAITPKPQTELRVFLDFQGLNKPIAIKPEKLQSVKRQGFTVVEWGGLLRNN